MANVALHDVLHAYSAALGVGVDEIAAEENFFLQGGTSIKALLLKKHLEGLGADIPPAKFWRGLSPAQVLAYLPVGQ